jgi:hypothetical protein
MYNQNVHMTDIFGHQVIGVTGMMDIIGYPDCGFVLPGLVFSGLPDTGVMAADIIDGTVAIGDLM